MRTHWIWLASRPSLSAREKLALLEQFRDPEDIYYADFTHAGGFSEEALAALKDKDLRPADQVLDECARKQIHILTWQDAAYPGGLKNIAEPPLVLYYRGTLPDFDANPVIGVVGTRKATPYGMLTAKRMGYQIGKCGGIVVSGAATGVDSLAMQGALTAGAIVVGVLGCGADVVYPAANRSLYDDTRQHGCLISEFPPGTPPYGWNFPKRNRIISGLSDGVLVVEAPEKSGALITARQASDQGRDVFVTPGNIDVASCAGSNALLRDGAIAVSCGWDVVGEYAHRYPDKVRKDTSVSRQTLSPEEAAGANVAQEPGIPAVKIPLKLKKDKKVIDNAKPEAYSDGDPALSGLNPEELAVTALLQGGEALVDDVIASTKMPAGKVLAILTMLEVRGVVTTLPGRRVKLKQ